jgi:hypothetical protein
MADAAPVPEPDANFEQRIWERVHLAIDASADQSIGSSMHRWTDEPLNRWRDGSMTRWLAPAVGLAAAVAIAVLAGRTWTSPRAPHEPAQPAQQARATVDTGAHDRVLLTALDDHFQRSEMLLVELMNAPAATRPDFAFERQTAGDLLDSSRLYRDAAQQNGNFRLASMLEDLESVLVEVARSPERMDAQEFRALRTRISDDNLLFKVRAVSNQIQTREKSPTTE